MYLDRISEAIAHFIGLFQIASEQARLRDDYLEFKARQAAPEQTPPDDHAPIVFQSPYDFDDPDPGVVGDVHGRGLVALDQHLDTGGLQARHHPGRGEDGSVAEGPQGRGAVVW